jgi:multidrug efflux pump
VLLLLHRRLLNPFALRFQAQTVPQMTERYRAFLDWVLDRDYTVPRAMLRNTLALGSFSAGFVLLILGAVINGISPLAGPVLLVPAGLLLAVGVVGILFHALESIFLGGKGSVRAGLWTAGMLGLLVALLAWGGRIDSVSVVVALAALPGVILLGGLAGMIFGRGRTHLVLTDNRARLLTGTLASLVAIFALFAVAPTGVEFFPNTDPNIVQVNLEAPLGTNLDASNAIAEQAFRRIDAVLEANPRSRASVETIATNVGVGGDAMFGGGAARTENSQVILNLVDFDSRSEASPVTLRRVREQLQGLPGVTTEITQDRMGPPTGKPVNIEVSGEDFRQLVSIASEVRARLERGAALPDESGRPPLVGLVDVTDNLNAGRPEFRIEIDRERAAAFGLSTHQIASTVRAAISGIDASTYRTGEREYDIMVRLRERDRASLEAIQSLTILYEGRQIPLVSVATIEVGSGLGAITRLNQQRVVTVSGSAAEGVNANELLSRVRAELADYEQRLPAGYTLRYTGESEEQQDAFGFLFTALLIAVALITLILLIQFNSISNPLIIMIATGLSLIGVMLGLIVTRTAFGLMTFVGVISLAGIVVNNSIVLVDYIEQLRRRGLDKRQAVIEGGATRLRPVLLTALTTIIGLIPLTFGINIDFIGLITNLDPNFQIGSQNTQFWGPMGTAIISGLAFATFLTLVIVPAMYSTFDSLASRLAVLVRPEPEDGPVDPAEALVPAPAGMLQAGNGHAGDGAPMERRRADS